MKTKFLGVLLAVILLISALGMTGIQDRPTSKQSVQPGDDAERMEHMEITHHMALSTPSVEYDSRYCTLSLPESNSHLAVEGAPVLPTVVKTFDLPFRARNVQVTVEASKVKQQAVDAEVLPAPVPVRLSDMQPVDAPQKRTDIYESNQAFPPSWYTYRIGCGLTEDRQRAVHVAVTVFPVRYIPLAGLLQVARHVEITVTYQLSSKSAGTATDAYDLVIITPESFSSELNRLVEHKNSVGIDTLLKTTEDIYGTYEGRDEPEQIKHFIRDAIEQWNITYVLLVGGLKSKVYATPRDTTNYGVRGWYLPVRYSNWRYWEGDDPGYITDLYYADIYKYENGQPVFDDWDSNGNDVFAEYTMARQDDLDLYPDVAVGRLACRTLQEVRDITDKIIAYEQGGCDPSWFKRIIGITGDGFLDQKDLNIQWDVNPVPDGQYTIYAQSTSDEGESGPLDIINITVDHDADTELSFNHDDHLKLQPLEDAYPAPPIAEIVSVSEGDVLGKNDYTYQPSESEAYLNSYYHWADVEYVDGILHIRGKSYDPSLYGNITDIHVWIKNSQGEIIFEAWRNHTIQISEGDWTIGDRWLHGRAGAFYYMPEDFDKQFLSTANGHFTGKPDVVEALNQGAGFVFFSGHGSPGIWANHYPGVPGNRQNADVVGLSVSDLFSGPPFFPMDQLANDGKPFICVVGGCHNSQFNVSAVPTALDWSNRRSMNTYGYPVPECWSWYIVKQANSGAIASIGNTGYGYGNLGEWATAAGVDNWITIEFFRQYAVEQQTVLGDAHSQTVAAYIDHFTGLEFPEIDDPGWDPGDRKTVEQWVLLGDPSLQMGGYP